MKKLNNVLFFTTVISSLMGWKKTSLVSAFALLGTIVARIIEPEED